MIGRKLRIAKNHLRNKSFREFILLLRQNVFSLAKILIFVRELDAFEDEDCENGLIRRGSLDRLAELRKHSEYNLWEFSCDIYDGVKDFFVYEDEGRVAHISWIYFNNSPNRIIRLKGNEAEIKYCYTLREFRGRSIYPQVLRTIQGYLKGKNCKRVFISVKSDNLPSIRGIRKANFTYCAKMHLIKFMGIQLTRKYRFSF